jgi:hypothetical protein
MNMKPFIAIVKETNGALDKYQDFDTLSEANAHITKYGGFVVDDPGGNTSYWSIDADTKKAVYDSAQRAADKTQRQWEIDIKVTDREMPRYLEDAVDEGAIVLKPGRVKDNYDAKKAIRARKPT